MLSSRAASPSASTGIRAAAPRTPLAVLLAALLAALLQPMAHAQDQLTRGPILQAAGPGGMTLVWQTRQPTAPTVEYRAATAREDEGWRIVASAERARAHVVTLAGLEPETAYQYRIRGDGALLYDGGAFQTWPRADADTLSFVVYGDNRTNHAAHGEVVRQVLREPTTPALLIHTGDLVESGIHPEQWEIFFRVERDLLARAPLYPAIGNHEDNSPLYFESLRLPTNGASDPPGRWYSFDAGPAHFVALDVVFADIYPGSPQYRWLENDLARTDRPWKFVYFHYPLYNASAPHGSNLRLRETLEPLFLRHRVSAVFAGHAHIYERADGAGNPPLLHIISGGGGAPTHKPGLEAWTRYTEASHHFLRVRIDGDRLTSVGVRADGSEFDFYEARLRPDGHVVAVNAAPPTLVVPTRTLLEFLGTLPGLLLVGFTLLFTTVVPLGASAALRPRRKAIVPVPSGPLPPARVPVEEDPHDWHGLPVLGLFGAVAGLLLLVLALGAPFQWLIGFDAYTVTLTLHAVVGVSLLLVAVTAGALGWRLAARRAPPPRWLTAGAAAAAVLALLSAILGNLLYATYRVSGGPMEQLIRKAPEAHRVLFEFKEYVGLVPLPLAVAAAFIVWRCRADPRRDRYLAELVALLLLLLAFYCLLPLGLGFAVTRLRGIL